MSKIIGVTVGTPISPSKLQQKIKPVKTVNGKSPDANGNVELDEIAGYESLTLGVHTDGLIYLFKNGEPKGVGLEIKAAEVEGGDVVGYIDENNNIVLKGNLAEDTYTVKYEMEDGTTLDIGNLVFTNSYTVTNTLTNCTTSNSATSVANGGSYSAVISANSGYTLSSVTVTMGGSSVSVSNGVISISKVTGDIVITAVATEVQTSNPNNILTNGAYGIHFNERWSASGNAYATCNGMISFAVPLADVIEKTIRIKGFTKDLKANSKGASWYIYNGNTQVGSLFGASSIVWSSPSLTDEGNGVYSIPVNTTTFDKVNGDTLYINLAVHSSASVSATDLADKVITIDKPIV
jgi:hypothetical protein